MSTADAVVSAASTVIIACIMTIAVIAALRRVLMMVIRSRSNKIWARETTLKDAWDSGYDAAIDDFPNTNYVEPVSETVNPHGRNLYLAAGEWRKSSR